MKSIVAGALTLMALLHSASASANTIATFELSNVAFFDGVNYADLYRVTGTFALDLTARTVKSVAIAAEPGGGLSGGSYTGSPVDQDYHLDFRNWNVTFYRDLFLGGSSLELNLFVVDIDRLLSIPPVLIGGNEREYSIFCPAAGGLCATRYYAFDGGEIRTLSVTQTPLPAGLPLLVTALGGLALVGWRRKSLAR
jgi:hypothetical protein